MQAADKAALRLLVELHNKQLCKGGLIVVETLAYRAWLNKLGVVGRAVGGSGNGVLQASRARSGAAGASAKAGGVEQALSRNQRGPGAGLARPIVV